MTLAYTTTEFIQKAKAVHNHKFNYNLVDYVSSKNKVCIICPTHGEFLQAPVDHLGGRGCKLCANALLSTTNGITTDEFVKRASAVHDNFYDYSLVEYKNSKIKINIICREHGNFLQGPAAHISGAGCPACKNKKLRQLKRMTTEEFVSLADKTHNSKYDYAGTNYVNNSVKVKIMCKVHGAFMQSPSNHIYLTQGCPRCACNISNLEIKWLDMLGIGEEYRNKTIYIDSKRVKPDAYNPITNTIYEFWGDYWHGNPVKYKFSDINSNNKKTFGELYKETLIKRDLILGAGYNLVEIWESDFSNR